MAEQRLVPADDRLVLAMNEITRLTRERDDALAMLLEIRPYLRLMTYFTRPDIYARVEALLERRNG